MKDNSSDGTDLVYTKKVNRNKMQLILNLIIS